MTGPATRIQARLERPDFRLAIDLAWQERVAVIFGPSGSGKTTLLEIILGLHPQARARVQLGGATLDDPARGVRVSLERRGLGWVPQDPSLFPHLSVRENLRFGRARAGKHGGHDFERAIEVLEIGDLLGRRVDQLSGGERQRVAIARALASGPRALLMDEPLAALDLPLRARVLPYLLRVRDELDVPILYITHDPDEALIVGQVVVVLDAGRVVALGPPREVLWSRAVLPLSESLGLENVFDARVVDLTGAEATVETAAGLRLVIPVRLAQGQQVRIGLRAEDIVLASDRPGRISARNVLEATVTACEHRDTDCFVHLRSGENLVAKVTPAAAERLGLRPDASVYAMIKAQALRRIA
jgi:molybdate transport system ATP-binding protein